MRFTVATFVLSALAVAGAQEYQAPSGTPETGIDTTTVFVTLTAEVPGTTVTMVPVPPVVGSSAHGAPPSFTLLPPDESSIVIPGNSTVPVVTHIPTASYDKPPTGNETVTSTVHTANLTTVVTHVPHTETATTTAAPSVSTAGAGEGMQPGWIAMAAAGLMAAVV